MCINLKRRPDRKKRMSGVFKDLKLKPTWITGIDGNLAGIECNLCAPFLVECWNRRTVEEILESWNFEAPQPLNTRYLKPYKPLKANLLSVPLKKQICLVSRQGHLCFCPPCSSGNLLKKQGGRMWHEGRGRQRATWTEQPGLSENMWFYGLSRRINVFFWSQHATSAISCDMVPWSIFILVDWYLICVH